MVSKDKKTTKKFRTVWEETVYALNNYGVLNKLCNHKKKEEIVQKKKFNHYIAEK